MSDEKLTSEPKYGRVVSGLSSLSLGFSMVLAILIGIGVGYVMEKYTGFRWLFWLGVFWGIGGAILNVYKVYKKQRLELEELAKDPKYKEYKDTQK